MTAPGVPPAGTPSLPPRADGGSATGVHPVVGASGAAADRSDPVRSARVGCSGSASGCRRSSSSAGSRCSTAGLIGALEAALTAPANLVGGWLSDRLRRPLLIIGTSLAVLAGTLAVLPNLSGLGPLIAAVALMSVFLQLYFRPLFAVPLQHFGTSTGGLTSGFGNLCANLGGFTFTYALGALRDATGSFALGYLVPCRPRGGRPGCGVGAEPAARLPAAGTGTGTGTGGRLTQSASFPVVAGVLADLTSRHGGQSAAARARRHCRRSPLGRACRSRAGIRPGGPIPTSRRWSTCGQR